MPMAPGGQLPNRRPLPGAGAPPPVSGAPPPASVPPGYVRRPDGRIVPENPSGGRWRPNRTPTQVAPKPSPSPLPAPMPRPTPAPSGPVLAGKPPVAGGKPRPGIGGKPTRPGFGGKPSPTPSGPAPNPWGMPPPALPGSGLPGQSPMPGDFNDPFASLLAAAPLMELNAQKQIAGAMADAGFTGNRWGSFAAGKAGEIGAETAMAQNKMLLDTLYNTSQSAEDRALQATGMGMQLGGMLDRQMQDRFMVPWQLGAWEQGRQDDFGRFAYQDFENNKLGWLPFLGNLAGGVGAGSPGQIYTTNTPGSPGAADWLPILASLFGGG